MHLDDQTLCTKAFAKITITFGFFLVNLSLLSIPLMTTDTPLQTLNGNINLNSFIFFFTRSLFSEWNKLFLVWTTYIE